MTILYILCLLSLTLIQLTVKSCDPSDAYPYKSTQSDGASCSTPKAVSYDPKRQSEARDYYKIHQGRKKALGIKNRNKMPMETNLARMTDEWKQMTKDARDAKRRQILGMTRGGNLPRHLRNIPSKVLKEVEQRLVMDPSVSREQAFADASAMYHYTPKPSNPGEDETEKPRRRQKPICKQERKVGSVDVAEEIARTNARLSLLLAPNPVWYSQASRSQTSSKDAKIVFDQGTPSHNRNQSRPAWPLIDLNLPANVDDEVELS